jgi:hypothetical protein
MSSSSTTGTITTTEGEAAAATLAVTMALSMNTSIVDQGLQSVGNEAVVLHHLLQNHYHQAFRLVVKMVQKKYFHLDMKH